MSRISALTVALLVLVLGSSAGRLGAETLQQSTPEGEITLLITDRGARLGLPGSSEAERFEVQVGQAAEFNSLRAVADRWWLAGTYRAADRSRRLFVLDGKGVSYRSLPAPPGQSARTRSQPVIVAAGSRVEGIVWLEGDSPRALRPYASSFDGERFLAPEEVAGPAEGSQTSLTATVLADGSWLVAWSRFDGRDDDVVWSRRAGATWSPPLRVLGDNDVPDITPALAPTSAGALLAWSRYDGNDYRLTLARFEDGTFTAEQTIGEAGALYPSWSGSLSSPRLLYLEASPRKWRLIELDESGLARRSASVETTDTERPLVFRPSTGEGIEFRWAGDAGGPGTEPSSVALWSSETAHR